MTSAIPHIDLIMAIDCLLTAYHVICDYNNISEFSPTQQPLGVECGPLSSILVGRVASIAFRLFSIQLNEFIRNFVGDYAERIPRQFCHWRFYLLLSHFSYKNNRILFLTCENTNALPPTNQPPLSSGCSNKNPCLLSSGYCALLLVNMLGKSFHFFFSLSSIRYVILLPILDFD